MSKAAIQTNLDQNLELAKNIGEEMRIALERSHAPGNMGKDITSLAPDYLRDRLKELNIDKIRAEVADAYKEKY